MISIDQNALADLIRQIVQDELTRITPRPERLRDTGIDAAIVAASAGTSEQMLNRNYHGQAAESVAWRVAEALGW